MTDPTKTADAKPKTADAKAPARKNPRWVKAKERGLYGQIREPGDVFENTLDLAGSWFAEAKEPKADGGE